MSQTLFVTLTILFAVAVIIIFYIIRKNKKKQITLRYLKSIWGTKNPDSRREFLPENRKKYFCALKENHPFHIDDITWGDLDMDRIFKRLNYTQSTAGEDFLYSMLRLPLFDQEQLAEREKLITLFQEDESLRVSLQYNLYQLGFSKEAGLAEWLHGSPLEMKISILPYLALAFLFLASPLFFLINPGFGIFMVLILMITNMTVHTRTTQKNLYIYLEPVKYLIRIISAAGKISKIKHESLNAYMEKLSELYRKLNTFSMQNFMYMQAPMQDPFTELLKTMFLAEIIFFKSAMKELLKNQSKLRELYNILGMLDSCLSIASFRDSVDIWCKPCLQNRQIPYFAVSDPWHPLIENPVLNSLQMDRPVLLTGSNASGKSTWLKVCAVNILLSQTIHTCTAKAYNGSYFRLFSSMALRDDIISGESYYIVEIRSLKRILDALEEEPPVFCVIDEVLRGTNTVERIAASSEVLGLIARKKCLCMAATHDLELVNLLKDEFTNFHFQEQISGEKIIFDYILYPGPARTRNAIRLLSLMGYDRNLAENAEQRAKRFMEKGVWE